MSPPAQPEPSQTRLNFGFDFAIPRVPGIIMPKTEYEKNRQAAIVKKRQLQRQQEQMAMAKAKAVHLQATGGSPEKPFVLDEDEHGGSEYAVVPRVPTNAAAADEKVMEDFWKDINFDF